MDDWSYVALAYAVVWGAVAAYALTLRQRIVRARAGVEHVRQAIDDGSPTVEQEEPACEAASVP